MIEGLIAQVPLSSMFKQIIAQELSGRLTITSAGESQTFYFSQGTLLNAKNTEGKVDKLFNLTKGEFHFDEAQEVPAGLEPELSTFRWIMDHAVTTTNQLAMQWALLSPFATPINVEIPVGELTDDEVRVAAMIDDKRTIGDIVKASSASDLFTIQVLFGLTVSSAISLKRVYEVIRLFSKIVDEFVTAMGNTRLTVNGAERMFGKALSESMVLHPELEYFELGGDDKSLQRFRHQFKLAADVAKCYSDMLERFYRSVHLFIEEENLEKILYDISNTYFNKHRGLATDLHLAELIDHIIKNSEEHERDKTWAAINRLDGGGNLR